MTKILRWLLPGLFCMMASQNLAAADDTLREKYRDVVIGFSSSSPAEQKNVLLFGLSQEQENLVRQSFESSPLVLSRTLRRVEQFDLDSQVVPYESAVFMRGWDAFDPKTLEQINTSQARIFALQEGMSAFDISIVRGNQTIVSGGTPVQTTQTNVIVLLTNAGLRDIRNPRAFDTIFVDQNASIPQLETLLAQAGIVAGSIRPADRRDFENGALTMPTNAIVTTPGAYEHPGMLNVLSLFAGPKTIGIASTFAYEDITAIATTGLLLSGQSNLMVKGSDHPNTVSLTRSVAQGFPRIEAASPSQITPSRPTWPVDEFARLTPNACHLVSQLEHSDRFAVVFGNGSYDPRIGYLIPPAADANDMAAMMFGLGFDVYYAREADLPAMRTCLEMSSGRSSEAKLGIFFFSGHGVQVEDQNFLIGIEAAPDTLDQANLLPVAEAFSALSSAAETSLFFLDACRDNGIGVASSGLAEIEGGQGTQIMQELGKNFGVYYAAAANTVANDGTGRNSRFTDALMEYLPTPGLSVNEAMPKITAAVRGQTEGAQRPFARSSIEEVLYLNGQNSLDDLLTSAAGANAIAMRQLEKGRNDLAASALLSVLPKDATNAELESLFWSEIDLLKASWIMAALHVEELESAAWDALILPETRRLLLRTLRGRLAYFDPQTGRTLHESDASTDKSAASLDESVLAYVRDSRTVVILDAASGDVRSAVSDFGLPAGPQSAPYPNALKFSADGTLLLIGLANWISVIDVGSGTPLWSRSRRMQVQGQQVSLNDGLLMGETICVPLSSDRQEGLGPVFMTLEARTGQQTGVLLGPNKLTIEEFSCSPDGQFALLTTALDEETEDPKQRLDLVNLETGMVLFSDSADLFSDGLVTGAFSQDGQTALMFVNGLFALDLDRMEFILSEPSSIWHWGAHGFGQVTLGNRSEPIDGQLPGFNQRLFDMVLSPRELVENSLAKLSDAELKRVQGERPLMAR